MNVLSIQSHVTYGHVGNAAAVFALQRLGHRVWPIHTVSLATHTGYGAPIGTVTDAATLRRMVDQLETLGVLADCDAVLTGYLGTLEVAETVRDVVEIVRDRNPDALWCCDPVMGDTGRGLFVDEAVASFFEDASRDADFLLPNTYELARLTGREAITLKALPDICASILDRETAFLVVTGLEIEFSNNIESVAASRSGVSRARVPRITMTERPNGAGDLFAAIFLGVYLKTREADRALAHAAAAVRDVLDTTVAAGGGELRLIETQDAIAAPSVIPDIVTG